MKDQVRCWSCSRVFQVETAEWLIPDERIAVQADLSIHPYLRCPHCSKDGRYSLVE